MDAASLVAWPVSSIDHRPGPTTAKPGGRVAGAGFAIASARVDEVGVTISAERDANAAKGRQFGRDVVVLPDVPVNRYGQAVVARRVGWRLLPGGFRRGSGRGSVGIRCLGVLL